MSQGTLQRTHRRGPARLAAILGTAALSVGLLASVPAHATDPIADSTNVQVSSTQTSVDVSWTAPSNATAAGWHHSYVVFSDSSGAQLQGFPTSVTAPGTSRSFNATEMTYYGITPGTSYQVQIMALGTNSSSLSAVKNFTVIAPATGVDVVNTVSSLDVSWTPPSNASAAALYRNYLYVYDAQGNQLGWQISLAAAATSRSLSAAEIAYYGITPGTTYQVQILSLGAGTSSWSAVRTFAMLAPATNLQTSTTSTSVDVSWTAPTNASAAGLQHYYLYVYDAQGNQLGWQISLAATTTSRTLNASELAYYGLTAGNTYQVQILALSSSMASWSAVHSFNF